MAKTFLIEGKSIMKTSRKSDSSKSKRKKSVSKTINFSGVYNDSYFCDACLLESNNNISDIIKLKEAKQ